MTLATMEPGDTLVPPGGVLGPEHLDVLVVGAGLSGIGAAHYLQTECPWATYAIFEARDSIGGTWDLFRYPGIRSDSDMHTLGYSFRPWDGEKSIADGDSILQYIKDTAAESGIDRHIRFDHRVVAADWSTDEARWQITGAARGRHDLRAHCGLPLLLYRLLPLRPRVPARLRRHGPVRGHPDPPPALARGPRLHRQASRGHRQRRHRHDAGSGFGPLGRPRDDAAALPELRRLPARSAAPWPTFFRRVLPRQQAGTAAKWAHALHDPGLLRR